MPVKFWQTRFRFWFFLSYLITTVHELTHDDMNRHKMTQNEIGLYDWIFSYYFFSGIISVDGEPKRSETVPKKTPGNTNYDKKPEIDVSSHPNSVYPNKPVNLPSVHANSPATLSVSFSCLILAFLLHNWFDLT